MKSKVSKKVAVFGGSFSPPHVGHISVLRTVSASGLVDEIWVMPSGERRDKKIGVSGADRAEMVRRMIADISDDFKFPLVISEIELQKERLTATYETKQMLEYMHPNFQFYFVLGGDSAYAMREKWVNGEALYNEGLFIIVTRSDEDSFAVPPQGKVLKNIGFKNTVDVSSTMIRLAIANREDISEYVTPGVLKYINEKKLYHL